MIRQTLRSKPLGSLLMAVVCTQDRVSGSGFRQRALPTMLDRLVCLGQPSHYGRKLSKVLSAERGHRKTTLSKCPIYCAAGHFWRQC